MANINVSLQVIPRGGDLDTYAMVDKAIEVIQKSGVKYEVGPMETTMEGDLDRLLEIVKEAQQACVDAGAERVISIVKIDYVPGGVTIDEKIAKYR